MTRFAELSECEFSTTIEEKDAENTKKATKVTLNIFRSYLQVKGLREVGSRVFDMKSQTRKCMYVKLDYTFLNCYYILATLKNLLY